MAINIGGSSAGTSSLSNDQIQGLYQEMGLTEKDLKKAASRFKSSDTEAPKALTKLIETFKTFDTNRDHKLSLTEIAEYARENRSSLESGSGSLIGDSEGINAKQLKVMRDILKKDKVENENLERLIFGFGSADQDKDGSLTTKEYEKYAKRKGIAFIDKSDKSSLEQILFQRALTSYTSNENSTLGFLVSSFVAAA
ncbi:hypothetical protein OAO01_05735 [Oligoflexia bacterium]|nr:hypothetical protein [Oligoflexia bacterium]